MKFLKMNNLDIVTYCRTQYNVDLLSTVLKKEVTLMCVDISCVTAFYVLLY